MTDRKQRPAGPQPEVHALAGPAARTRRRGRFNPVALLSCAGACVVVYVLSTNFLFNKAPAPTEPFIVKSEPKASPSQSGLVIWPILGRQYPSLRRHWHDYAGTRYVAVPNMFWNTMLPAEKVQLAGDLDVLFPRHNWVIVTGPYRGGGKMALRKVHRRGDLAARRSAVARVADAETEIPKTAPTPKANVVEADLVKAARRALAADPIVKKPAVVARVEPERPAPPTGFPEYEILFQTDDPLGRRVFAEVLVSALSTQTPQRDRRRVSQTIAELEGLDDLTLYCTRQAHEAHYSMDYADRHPNALARGLLGSLERGRFKLYKPR